MDPTLEDGEFGFTSLASVWLNQINRYDIVVVTTQQDMTDSQTGETTNETIQIVKRVIGMPGGTVSCIDDEIYINGAKLDEDYIDPDYIKECREKYGYFNQIEQISTDDEGRTIVDYVDFPEVTLGEDEYFVMGDNRNNSSDSRTDIVGNIKREDIIGKAWLRIWPLSDFGVLKHQ